MNADIIVRVISLLIITLLCVIYLIGQLAHRNSNKKCNMFMNLHDNKSNVENKLY